MELEEYLAQLRDSAEPLKAADLVQLSSLSFGDSAVVRSHWHHIANERRRRILSHLSQLGEDNVEYDFDSVYLLGLDDSDDTVRLDSLRGLWENESPALESRLITLAETDPSATVRAEASLALGRFVLSAAYGRLGERRTTRVEDALRKVFEKKNEIEEVRARALEAMGPLDLPWVRQAISQAYESGNLRLKASAVHAMGRSCEPRWLPFLYGELISDEAELRYEAATACGAFGDEEAIPNLVRLIMDEDDEVQAAAVAALGEIGGQRAKDALMILLDSELSATREAAAAALAAVDFEEDPLAVKYRG
ncbi:MAG: HEAT repeat domain-containing protein [Dehalococcoidia bacterium]